MRGADSLVSTANGRLDDDDVTELAKGEGKGLKDDDAATEGGSCAGGLPKSAGGKGS